jgi:hypothetical protein
MGLLALLLVLIFLGSIVLLFRKGQRRKGVLGAFVSLSLLGFVAGAFLDSTAREAGFADSSDQLAAQKAGFPKAADWAQHQAAASASAAPAPVESIPAATKVPAEIAVTQPPAAPQPTPAEVTATEKAPPPAQVLPADQLAVRDAITSARQAFTEAKNDLVRGGMRPKRGKALCDLLPGRVAKDWVGTVYDLTTNGDGWGVFSVEMDGEIWISTWYNSMSDRGYSTLIDPEGALFKALSGLSEGQTVIFSGNFFEDNLSTDCFREKSLTIVGAMSEPDFVFAFSEVRPAP